ncbi:MAG TPA: DUF1343 domain-containing protein [Bacteroidales bacterium]|nr:DUF1343 domain-containing protein [Bacteroidales bacterium]
MKKTVVLLVLIFNSMLVFSQVKPGIDVLREKGFAPLLGKRVGLITNPTGVDSQLRSTIDILHEAPGVQLVALFGPEHGVRGEFPAGELIDDKKDPITGITMYSLYGRTRKPTREMLKGIDILVYDIQDIGSRSYTYISTLGLAMEAAAEQGIEFMVLDRPNPLGGNKFEGPLVKEGFISFVSQFPIPYVHGFTVGELAKFLNGERLLANGIQAKLTVIEMQGWERNMTFEETGLHWVLASPHIPHAITSYYYPASGILGELHVINIGVGYTLPFQTFAIDWIRNASELSNRLNNLEIPGVIFRPIHYRAFYTDMKNKMLHGVQVHIIDAQKAPLSLLQFYFLQELKKLHPEKNVFELAHQSRLDMFDKVCGTDQVRKAFGRRFLVEDILPLWTKEIPAFIKRAEKYFLY